jgi:hypothetical protein
VQELSQEPWMSSDRCGFDQHGKTSTWAKGEVSIPGGDSCDGVLWLQEWLCMDLEDPQVFVGWLPPVPTKYLTITALLDPVGGLYLIGHDGDVKHGIEAIVGLEALRNVIWGGMGGAVELLLQYLDVLLEGFGEGLMVVGAVLEGVLQYFNQAL